jgi:hypothetical protein
MAHRLLPFLSVIKPTRLGLRTLPRIRVSVRWEFVVALVVAFASLLLLINGPQVSLETIQRVKEGMTEEDVVALIGFPSDEDGPGLGGNASKIWNLDGLVVTVGFDPEGNVTDCLYTEVPKRPFFWRFIPWLQNKKLTFPRERA